MYIIYVNIHLCFIYSRISITVYINNHTVKKEVAGRQSESRLAPEGGPAGLGNGGEERRSCSHVLSK